MYLLLKQYGDFPASHVSLLEGNQQIMPICQQKQVI